MSTRADYELTAADRLRADLREGLAERLATAMGQAGLTVEDLADRTGASERAIRGWRNGSNLAGLDQVAALADALGVGRGWLAYG